MPEKVCDKVVVRFRDGRLVRGYIEDFSANAESLKFRESRKKQSVSLSFDDLKAIFFVKTFRGDKDYREKKIYGISERKGKRIFVRFKDGESLIGFTEGDTPWRKGFFLDSSDKKTKGFIVFPTDADGNNIKIYVINSAVEDITMVG
jgi:hypothetical protein